MKKLCMIIPAKDEAVVIEATITSLIKAGMSPSDIYLVDDFSSDNTGEIGRDLKVNVLRNEPNLGKAHAVKRAVEYFTLVEDYEFIGLMDADTQVGNFYTYAVLDKFKSDDIVAVCGRPKSARYNWLTAYRAYCYAYTHFIYRGAQSKMGVINVAPGCATVYRSSIWHKLDWSKDTIVEDMDVTIQIHTKSIGRISYAPDAIVHTQDPRTLRDYIKQMMRWNTGLWQVFRKHKLYVPKRRVAIECLLLTGESLLFSPLALLLPLSALIFGGTFLLVWLAELGMIIGLGAIFALLERRLDILLFASTFPVMRWIDSSIFLCSFWKGVIRRQKNIAWFSPTRYSKTGE